MSRWLAFHPEFKKRRPVRSVKYGGEADWNMSSDDWKEGGPWADWEHNRPLGPIVVTIVSIIVWLVFILFYALYWSTGFTLFQNVIVTVVTLVIVALVMGLVWVVWGMKYARPWKESKHSETAG